MREKGDLVRIRTPFSYYLVNEPELIEHILETTNLNFGKDTLDYRLFNRFLAKGIVSNEGELWQKVNKLSRSYFNRGYNEQQALAIKQGLDATFSKWEIYAEQGKEIDLGNELARLCFRISCQILFGSQTKSYEVADYIENVNISPSYGISLLLKYLPNKSSREHRLFHRQFDNLIKLAGDNAVKNNIDCLYTKLENSLTQKELLKEMKVLIFGSHATLSNLLTWSLYFISKDRTYSDLVDKELSLVNPEYNDFSFIPKLKFTSQLFKEVMRLYPPVWMMTRNCKITHKFKNYVIPKGSSFMILPWSIHRNAHYWQNPDDFDPSRFADNNNINKKAFIPFSDGSRKCMGQRLALMEQYMICTKLLKKFKLSILNTDKIEAMNCLSPKPSNRIMVKLEVRENSDHISSHGSVKMNKALG
jgi:cytochrome P450